MWNISVENEFICFYVQNYLKHIFHTHQNKLQLFRSLGDLDRYIPLFHILESEMMMYSVKKWGTLFLVIVILHVKERSMTR